MNLLQLNRERDKIPYLEDEALGLDPVGPCLKMSLSRLIGHELQADLRRRVLTYWKLRDLHGNSGKQLSLQSVFIAYLYPST
ncbi:hypothetical protein TNCV_4616081 [Trichonephila clavipes]|nr:hypothetical protein TNCV_4616081 [Trichonephila clavipes]